MEKSEYVEIIELIQKNEVDMALRILSNKLSMIIDLEKSEYIEIIELIQKKEKDQSLKILTYKLSNECLQLIRNTAKKKGEILIPSEAKAVFNDAFIDLSERILHPYTFKFEGDEAFTSYFKRSCVNQTYNFVKKDAGKEQLLSKEMLEKEEKYDFEFEIDAEDKNDFDNLLKQSFLQLSPECQIMIILFYFIKLSHLKISETLSNYYEINSPDVSKTKLYRCRQRLKDNFLTIRHKL